MPERRPLRRGEIIGELVGPKPASEAEYYERCLACGGWVDIRDLAQVSRGAAAASGAGPAPVGP